MKINISVKIIGIVFLLSFIIFSSLSYINIKSYTDDLTKSFIERAKSTAYSMEVSVVVREDIKDKDKLISIIQKNMWLDSEITEISFNVPNENNMITYVSSNPEKINKITNKDNFDSYINNTLINKITESEKSRILKIITPIHVSGEELGTIEIYFTLENIDAKVKSLIKFLIVGYLLMMVLFTTILFFYLRSIVIKPILEINNGAQEIAKNNLNYNIKVKSSDEIGKLADTFEEMAVDLRKARNEIRKHEQELEEKILQRTKELDKKVKESEEMRLATMNIMEDVDEANKQLMDAQEKLKGYVNELKVVDRKKDEFISIAAHELKTPLTSIRGFAELLQNKSIASDADKRDKYFSIIVKDTTRLGKLITDILDLSRMDLGTLKLNIQNVKANELMKDLIDQMDIIIRQKGVKPVYDIEKKMPNISIDKDRLIQVISNLINNAVHYTDKGGQITVKAYSRGKNVYFLVADTGRGIPKDHLPRIFDRFYQVDSSYTRKIGGTGLGLAICNELVQAMGGTIHVTSTVGKGTTFMFNIPINYKKVERVKEIDTLKEHIEKIGK